jgi:monoterpene epsilon-lactone hydrolase
MSSIQANAIKTYMRLKRLLSPPRGPYDVAKTRAETEAMSSMFKALVPGQCEPVVAKGIRGEWLVPAEVIKGRVVLYLHGGYYNAGSAHSTRTLAMNTGYAAKACVLSIDYRLAPENPYPAALEDALLAYEWLLEEEYSPGAILLAGDSAGGGLVLCLLLRLRERNLPLPAAAICYSPWTDLALSGESYQGNGRSDVMLDLPSFEQSARIYLGSVDPHTPYASPVYGDLQGLPPLLIQVGSDEMLLSDATSFAERAKAAGVAMNLEVWRGMQHEWQFAAKAIPEGREAIQHVRRFVDSLLLVS